MTWVSALSSHLDACRATAVGLLCLISGCAIVLVGNNDFSSHLKRALLFVLPHAHAVAFQLPSYRILHGSVGPQITFCVPRLLRLRADVSPSPGTCTCIKCPA